MNLFSSLAHILFYPLRVSLILYLSLSNLFEANLHAQNVLVHTQHYSTEEGLSHRDVQSVYQDAQGIMWFGTKYGLNRFDGYNFKWYTKETHGLQSNMVNHIFEDDNGRLWLIDTDSHFLNGVRSIDIFNPKTETSTSFDTFATDQIPFKTADITLCTQNQDGNIIFFTNNNQLTLYAK